MKRQFRITTTRGSRDILWLIDRCCEPGSYALDELFSEEEAARFQDLLKSRKQDFRVEVLPPSPRPEQLRSWTLLGRLFRLAGRDADQLPFRVVGCA
jgi:hypothetical protein